MTYNEQYTAYLQAVDTQLAQAAQTHFKAESVVAQAAKYSLFAGGKRVRGVLCMAVCDMLQGDTAQAADFACTVEMLHCYSLIHDDLPCMDNDDTRRGKPSCHKAYGEANALLAGDALLTAAFATAASAAGNAQQKVEAVALLAKCAGTKGMIYGQELDVQFENTSIPQEMLEKIHHYKTGKLINAASVMGAVAATASEKQKQAVSQYAYAIGLVFQVIDDILDVTASEAELGKPVGSDNKNGKTTYVTLLGAENAFKMAQQLTHDACTALQASFGARAAFLIQLAQQLLTRKK